MNPAETAAAGWLRALLALDGAALGGVWLRARQGPALAFWREALSDLPGGLRSLPGHISDDRLLGGIDLGATLAGGCTVHQRGLLAESDGRRLWLPMAERARPALVAQLTGVLDRGEVLCERDGRSHRWPCRVTIIASDEAHDDEPGLAPSLADRLAFWVAPGGGSAADADAAPTGLPGDATLPALRERLPRVRVSDGLREALCATAMQLGVASLRAVLFTLRAVRASAVLCGRDEACDEDALRAVRLVLAPRATRRPDEHPPPRESPPPVEGREPGDADRSDPPPEATDADTPPLDERLVAAAAALLPERLLALLAHGPAGSSEGRVGELSRSRSHGRPLGSRAGKPGGGARLNVVETLRAAAPWQRLRRGEAHAGDASPRMQVRSSDLRIWRLQQRAATGIVFVVDASGSSALHRLAEAKGAVQLLLADCYARRDQVAVVAFRGQGAELLLPLTRSLVRARRALAALPGGGGTPLAAGLERATRVALQARRAGATANIVLLTDGRANIGRDGTPGRAAAEVDAHRAARQVRALQIPSLLVDTSPQPAAAAARLAEALGASYRALPHAHAGALAQAVRGIHDGTR